MDNILFLFNPWWEKKSFFTGTVREKYLAKIKANLVARSAILLVGSRRAGKTTLIYQTVKYLLEKKNPAERIVYLPLDHPGLQGRKILDILEEVRTIHGLKRSEKLFLFLDEVQFFPGWEQEAKAIVDFENIKLILSGSVSASILAKGSFLTGRTLTVTVKPFDFSEFVATSGKTVGKTDTALLDNFLGKYLRVGGYPEYVVSQNPLYFSDLVTSVISKDIGNLFAVKNTGLVSLLLSLLADRCGSQTSFSKLGEILDLTKDTIREYIYYLSATFLVSGLGKFSHSRNAVVYSPKKFYLLDSGLLFNLTGKLNLGAAAENAVFAKLSQESKDLGFYFENQKEVDFMDNSGEAFEVKFSLPKTGWENLAKNITTLPTEKFKKIIILPGNPRRKEIINGIPVQFCRLANFLL